MYVDAKSYIYISELKKKYYGLINMVELTCEETLCIIWQDLILFW